MLLVVVQAVGEAEVPKLHLQQLHLVVVVEEVQAVSILPSAPPISAHHKLLQLARLEQLVQLPPLPLPLVVLVVSEVIPVLVERPHLTLLSVVWVVVVVLVDRLTDQVVVVGLALPWLAPFGVVPRARLQVQAEPPLVALANPAAAVYSLGDRLQAPLVAVGEPLLLAEHHLLMASQEQAFLAVQQVVRAVGVLQPFLPATTEAKPIPNPMAVAAALILPVEPLARLMAVLAQPANPTCQGAAERGATETLRALVAMVVQVYRVVGVVALVLFLMLVRLELAASVAQDLCS